MTIAIEPEPRYGIGFETGSVGDIKFRHVLIVDTQAHTTLRVDQQRAAEILIAALEQEK